MIQAVIFDMDGVLMDSEPESLRQHQAVAARFSIALTQEELDFCLGIPLSSIWTHFQKKYSIPLSVEELVALEQQALREKFSSAQIPPIQGAFAALESLKNAGYQTGIATSNFDFNVASSLLHNGATHLVDAIAHHDSVPFHKPSPDVFLCCAQQLGVLPENCAVIEDSYNGLVSARRAGMKVVSFRYDGKKPFYADHSLEQMKELTPQLIASL